MSQKESNSTVFLEEVFAISKLQGSLHPIISYIKLLFRYTLELLFFLSVTDTTQKNIQIPLFNLKGIIQIPMTLLYTGLLICKWFSSRSALTNTGRALRYPIVFFLASWPSILFPFKFYVLLSHLNVAAEYNYGLNIKSIWTGLVFGDLILSSALLMMQNMLFCDLRPISRHPENILDGYYFHLSQMTFILRTTVLIASKAIGSVSSGLYYFKMAVTVLTCLVEIGSFVWLRPYFNHLFEKTAGYCCILIYYFMIVASVFAGLPQANLIYVLSVWMLLASFHMYVDTQPSYQGSGAERGRLVDIKALLSANDLNTFERNIVELGKLKIEDDRYKTQEPNNKSSGGYWRMMFTVSRMRTLIQKKGSVLEYEGLNPDATSPRKRKKNQGKTRAYQDMGPVIEDLYQKNTNRQELNGRGTSNNLERQSGFANLMSVRRSTQIGKNQQSPKDSSSPLLNTYDDHPKLLVKKLVYNYLRKDDSYHLFLKLLWHLRHEFHLGMVFTLLNQMKYLDRTFKDRLMYHAALQETKGVLYKELKSQNAKSVEADCSNGSDFGLQALSCLDHSLQPQIKLARVFHYKELMEKLTHGILDFTDVNHQYISLIRDPAQGVHIKFNMCNKLWLINERVENYCGQIKDLVGSQFEFHHLLVNYYHLFINVNRHSEAKSCRKDLFKRVQLTHKSITKNQIDPNIDNLINESLILQIESQKPKFGKISNVYGNFRLVAESADELLDISYTNLMTDSLIQRHSSVAKRLYREEYSQFMESRIKPGFLKGVGRTLIVPGTTIVKISPSVNTDFRFLACLKADFKDTKLYISLKEDPDFFIDGYSHNFLSILPESFLLNCYLQEVAPNISKRLKSLRMLLRSKTPLSHRANKGSISEINQLETFYTEATSHRNVLSLNDMLEPFNEVPLNALVFKETIKFLNENEAMIEKTFHISVLRRRFGNLTLFEESIPDGYWVLCLKPVEAEDDKGEIDNEQADLATLKTNKEEFSDKRESEDNKTNTGSSNIFPQMPYQKLDTELKPIETFPKRSQFEAESNRRDSLKAEKKETMLFSEHIEEDIDRDNKATEKMESNEKNGKFDADIVENEGDKRSNKLKNFTTLTKVMRQLSISKDADLEKKYTLDFVKQQTLTVPSKLELGEVLEDRELEGLERRSRSKVEDTNSQRTDSQNNKMIVIKIPAANSQKKKKVVILEGPKEVKIQGINASPNINSRRKSIWAKPKKKKLAKAFEAKLQEIEDPEHHSKFGRNIANRKRKAPYLCVVLTFLASLALYSIANLWLNLDSRVAIWGSLISKLNGFSSIFMERKHYFAHLLRESAYLTGGVFPDRYTWSSTFDPKYLSCQIPFSNITQYLAYIRSKSIGQILERTNELYQKVNSKEDMLFSNDLVTFNVSTDYKTTKEEKDNIWGYLEFTNLEIGLTKELSTSQVRYPTQLNIKSLMVNFANYEIINQAITTGLGIRDTFAYLGTKYFFEAVRWLLATLGVILIELTIAIVAMILLFRRFRAIHWAFSTIKAEDRSERLAQLEYSRSQLKRIIADNYFGFTLPKHEYTLTTNPEVTTVSNKPPETKKRKTKCYLFGLGPLALFVTSFYIIVAAITYLTFSFIEAKGYQMIWLAEKNIGAQRLANTYLDFWNNISAGLFVRNLTIQFRPSFVFLIDYDKRIEAAKGTLSELLNMPSSRSTLHIPEIYKEIQTRFTGPLCEHTEASLKTLCENMHPTNKELGLATAVTRMNSDLLHLYYNLTKTFAPGITHVSRPEFIRMEFTALTLYLPLLTKFARDFARLQATYLENDPLSSLQIFFQGNWAICACYAVVSIWVFSAVWTTFKVNYFAFHLLSLNSYERNQALKVAMLNNLSAAK